MKKNIVLFVLFILPIVAYLFFASGVNSFTKLPIITPKVSDLGNWKSLNGQKVSLDNKITILGFSGSAILKNRGNYFNLNSKIYDRYHTFKDLQFVVTCPLGTENEAQKIIDVLGGISDISQWYFVFASPEEINASSNSSKTSSSTLDFPTIALFNLLKKEFLDFSSPLSRVSLLSFPLNLIL